MGVMPALDEIEDGEAGFGVRPKGVAVDEFAVGLSAEIMPGLTNSSSSARRMAAGPDRRRSGFHCVTLDIRRTGTLQRYFD